MCGIAGFFSISKVDNSIILNLTKAIKHRGPDDEGYIAVNPENCQVSALIGDDSVVIGEHIENYYEQANLFLGHRRLSIIDITPAGHQPLSNDDGKIWIVFNGEIYNYIELREELKRKGYIFKTATDTEVIIKAYEEWGFDCLNKFNGMWAFVILDLNKRILFGARDRFGVKPLYYHIDNNHFAFASEIKALLTLPWYKKEINETAVFDYLVLNLEEYEAESFFKNIMELKPAHYFIYDLREKTFLKEKYYNLPFNEKFENYNEDKVKEHFLNIRDLIFNAVNVRLRSDVPVGKCLSGGLDSSTIACVIDSLLRERDIEQIGTEQKFFTACYDDSRVDESKWAEIVVRHTRAKWFKTFPKGEELIEDLNDLVYYQELPFGSTSIYAQYRVMKLAKENGVKVLLDGQGGDELFAGYHIYYKTYLAELIKNGYFKEALKEFIKIKGDNVNLLMGLLKILLFPLVPVELRNFFGRYKYPASKFLNPDFLNKFKNRFFREDIFDNLNVFLFKHITYLNLKTLLRYEDRNSMRFSIESRTPFADDINLIEYVFKIPSTYKIHNGWTKYLMRNAMDGVIPEEIQWRRDKIGFATPEQQWFKKNSNKLKSCLINDLKCFLKMDDIDKNWNRLMATQNIDLTRFIWRIINLSLWYKKFF